jgi:Holliday junction DNA helicase RuvA
MISFLKGTIQDLTDQSIIVDVHDIGYELLASTQTLEELECYKDVKLHTYLNVREDEMTLFGFYSKDELTMFKLLIKVNGVGPKAALSILSTLDTNNLRYAILAGDSKAISKAKGVGAKTAERILIDLGDKVSSEDLFEHIQMPDSCVTIPKLSEISAVQTEVMEALEMLGYSAKVAKLAISEVESSESMDTETLLKETLKRIK